MMDIENDMTPQDTIKPLPDGYEEALLKALEYQSVRRSWLPKVKDKNEIHKTRRNNNNEMEYRRKRIRASCQSF